MQILNMLGNKIPRQVRQPCVVTVPLSGPNTIPIESAPKQPYITWIHGGIVEHAPRNLVIFIPFLHPRSFAGVIKLPIVGIKLDAKL